jgi:hypothetical protein
LLAAGFRVIAIRAPTVPRGSERLRITLSAAHSEEQVDALVESLSQLEAVPSRASKLAVPDETAAYGSEASGNE